MKDVIDFDHIALKEAMDQLSPKEILVVVGLMEGKTSKQAMLDAGYSRSMAETQQNRVVGRERVKRAFFILLESQGSFAERLARVMKEGLDATRVVVARGGSDMRIEPDHNTRLKYIITVLKIMGLNHEEPEPESTETYESFLLRIKDEVE